MLYQRHMKKLVHRNLKKRKRNWWEHLQQHLQSSDDEPAEGASEWGEEVSKEMKKRQRCTKAAAGGNQAASGWFPAGILGRTWIHLMFLLMDLLSTDHSSSGEPSPDSAACRLRLHPLPLSPGSKKNEKIKKLTKGLKGNKTSGCFQPKFNNVLMKNKADKMDQICSGVWLWIITQVLLPFFKSSKAFHAHSPCDANFSVIMKLFLSYKQHESMFVV